MTKQYPYTWEQAIELLRRDPQHEQLIRDSYLSADLLENCRRFEASEEFAEILKLIRAYMPQAHRVLDLPAGNGIASYAFAKSGYEVAAVEPDPSESLGRGAIAFIMQQEGLKNICPVEAYGEELPFADEEFDVAYVRQGLHHARDLKLMVSELARVLRPGGLLIASREPVVDDYEAGLQKFLDEQPDHQLYGGENAFKHEDYLRALRHRSLALISDLGPYDSVINLHPNSFDKLEQELVNSRSGRILNTVLPRAFVYRLALMALRRITREQGRLHTFVARKLNRKKN
ncbi:MAG: class I SAM-dependent methyltransferase [Pyrinomonadaceae bacterium]